MLSMQVGSCLCLVLFLPLHAHWSQIFIPCVLLSQLSVIAQNPFTTMETRRLLACPSVPTGLHKAIYSVFQRHLYWQMTGNHPARKVGISWGKQKVFTMTLYHQGTEGLQQDQAWLHG